MGQSASEPVGNNGRPPILKTVTMDSVRADFGKSFNVQMNSAVVAFMSSMSDEQLQDFFPENVSDMDAKLNEAFETYINIVDPTAEEIREASTLLFFMSFLERVMEQCGMFDEEDDPIDMDGGVSGEETS